MSHALTLPERITIARGAMPMKTFAEKLKVTLSAASQWESGRKQPKLDNLRKIARLTKTPLAILVG